METPIIGIQARMNSSRLPQKVMLDLNGCPLIFHVLSAIEHVIPRPNIFLLTTSNDCDEPIRSFCENRGFNFKCGEEDDVASRFVNLATDVSSDYIVRISADSPFFDPAIIIGVQRLCCLSCYDLITTVSQKPYPSGMHIEAIRREVLLTAYHKFSESRHFEHVTTYFYENREDYAIFELECPMADVGRCKFSVDTREDFERMKALFSRLSKPHYMYSLKEKYQMFIELFG